MRAFFILFRKELRSFFLSPLAYVLMALFVFLNAFVFGIMVETMSQRVSSNSLIFNLFSSLWFWMGALVLFPLITMRLFAEEKKLGTIEVLFTAPVRTWEVVAAKYLATVVLYLILLLPVFLFFPLLHQVTGAEGAYHSGAFWGSGLILLLAGLFYIAIGIFASALTSNQLIAAMITFVAVLLHFFLGYFLYATNSATEWTATLTYFSTIEHVRLFSEGVIDSRPIVYYLSFSLVFLFLTHHVLEYRRWRA